MLLLVSGVCVCDITSIQLLYFPIENFQLLKHMVYTPVFDRVIIIRQQVKLFAIVIHSFFFVEIPSFFHSFLFVFFWSTEMFQWQNVP